MSTVFEVTLPPEPPIGTVVEDVGGSKWTRTGEAWECDYMSGEYPWWFILTNYDPLTLVSLPKATYAMPPEPEGPVWDVGGTKWERMSSRPDRWASGWASDWTWIELLANAGPLTNYDPKEASHD